jgi:hypothetical protein
MPRRQRPGEPLRRLLSAWVLDRRRTSPPGSADRRSRSFTETMRTPIWRANIAGRSARQTAQTSSASGAPRFGGRAQARPRVPSRCVNGTGSGGGRRRPARRVLAGGLVLAHDLGADPAALGDRQARFPAHARTAARSTRPPAVGAPARCRLTRLTFRPAAMYGATASASRVLFAGARSISKLTPSRPKETGSAPGEPSRSSVITTNTFLAMPSIMRSGPGPAQPDTPRKTC